MVAQSDGTAPSRDDIESTVTFLSEQLPTAETMEIHGAAFDIYRDDADRWRWRLIDDQRRQLAQSGGSVHTENEAVMATNTFSDRFVDARVLVLESIGIELFEAGPGWRWRIVSPTDETIVTSTGTFADRAAAETAAQAAADGVVGAPVLTYGRAGFEIVPTDEGWSWRLRAETDELIATHEGADLDEAAIGDRAARTRAVLEDAVIVEYDDVDCEVYPADDDDWRWRLVSDERELLAESGEAFNDEAAARNGAESVKESILAADLIEFEEAAFQQYEIDEQWRWRLIDAEGQVLADSGEEYGSKEAVRDGMTTLKEHAPDADVLEIDAAAFEIYRNEDGQYTWRLIDEGGALIAHEAGGHDTRAGARDAVASLTAAVEATQVRTMDEAVFQLVNAGEEWTVRLIDVDGTVLGTTVDGETTRDGARERIERFRAEGTSASIDRFGPVTVKRRNGGSWQFELIEPDRTVVASGEQRYDSAEATETDIELLTEHASQAPMFTVDEGIVWASPDPVDGTWRWQLVGRDREILGVAARSTEDLDSLFEAVETIKSRVQAASQFEIETLALEIAGDDGGWYWRALDSDEAILAVAPGTHEHRDDVTVAMDRAREAAIDASILEIDDPAFEFHERDDGWVWRLLDATGTPLSESVEPHPTRQEAREEMLAAKEHGPDGEMVVTW